jgi:outer membrane immunogenic protein
VSVSLPGYDPSAFFEIEVQIQMKTRLLLLASALLLIGPAVAHAADISRPVYKAQTVAPVAPIAPWAGWYGGVTAGYGWGDPSADVNPASFPPRTGAPFSTIDAFVPGAPFSLHTRPEGAIAGLFLGYNWQFQNIVIGWEADFSWTDLTDTQTGSFFSFVDYDAGVGGIRGNVTLDSKLRWLGTFRGRWGYVVGPVLPYITGGLAYGNLISTITSSGTQFEDATSVAFSGTQRFSDWLVGYTIGAGFDWNVSGNWRFRGEYLYVNLGGRDHLTTGVPAVTIVRNDFDAHLARFAIIYRIP